MTNTSRKRSRSCDHDVCEFLPISKRINNIHIRSNGNGSREECRLENGIHGMPNVNINGENHGHHIPNQYPDPINYQRINYPNNSSDPQQPSFSGTHHSTANCHGGPIINYNGSNGSAQWMSSDGGTHLGNMPLPFEPELDERQNPIYYQVNEMLYSLHVERMRRTVKHLPHQLQ
ncbi:hypothetical protein CHUAL_011522 [Chamberlinius hualienensis]